VELLIAVNPDPESSLKYLMRLPLAGGMVFRTSGDVAADLGSVLPSSRGGRLAH